MTATAAHVLAMAVVRNLEAADWPEVAAIYREGMRDGLATFETEVPSWEAWDVSHLAAPRLVACVGDRVAGWAALSPTSTRRVYRGVAEVSVYVARDRRRQGVGRRLLDALVAASERQGIWTLQAGVFPENRGSLALHERCGFRVVGIRERLGRRDGIWRDVVLLERRSEVVT
ncbi:MAG TPA: GNAT family N-acetyltransferase [Gaiellaceae bacterium]|jgi:phosphinothricin acetyltransferase